MGKITFVGSYPTHKRIVTDFMSLDTAVAGIGLDRNVLPGLPTHCGYHIWSKETGLGKSVVTFSLAGIIAMQLNKNIAICPTDTFDLSNLQSILEHTGMEGEVEIIMNPKGHGASLDDLNVALSNKKCAVTVLDSAYATMSTAVDEGGSEDANMGRDAKMISTYVRQAKGILDANPTVSKAFFVTNMSFVNVNARRAFGPPPYEPARGRTLMGLTSIHIDLYPAYFENKAVRFDKGRLLSGRVMKSNFGPTGREFQVFTIGGLGIHKGLTAVFDCLGYRLAKIKAGKVELEGETFPSPINMLKDYTDDEMFIPFLAVLDANKGAIYVGELVKPKPVYGAKKKEKVVEEDVEEETDEEVGDENE